MRNKCYMDAPVPPPDKTEFTALSDALRAWIESGQHSSSQLAVERLSAVLRGQEHAAFRRLLASSQEDLAVSFETQCGFLWDSTLALRIHPGEVDDAELTAIWKRTSGLAHGLVAWAEHLAVDVVQGRLTLGASAVRANAAGHQERLRTEELLQDPKRLIPVAQIPEVFAALFPGRHVSRPTAWRWSKCGIKGIRLQCWQVGAVVARRPSRSKSSSPA